MKRVFVITAVFALLCVSVAAQAVVIDTVRVGDAGNAADTGHYNSYGAVSYSYNIGKYEVTTAQYCEFLNAKAQTDQHGLYDTRMTNSWGCQIQRTGDSGNYFYSVTPEYANRPVNYVNFWDACRFTNWLSNGQGVSDTETGAYTLNGINGSGGETVVRNSGATWAVASLDEWYKAAYYKGGGTNAGYWNYATRSDTLPTFSPPPGGANSANYGHVGYHTTDVGAYTGSYSAYGAFDMNGNVWEWNDDAVAENTLRALRGGAYSFPDFRLAADDAALCESTTNALDSFGFRVVQVPEPSSVIALAAGLVTLVGMRRHRK